MQEFIDAVLNGVGPRILYIAGALILAAIGAYLTRLNNRRNRFLVVSEDFHHSFLDTIALFSNQGTAEGLYEHLETSFPIHKKAILSFRNHLGFFQRRGLDKAWNSYRYDTNKMNPPPEKELPIPLLVQYAEGLNWDETREDTKNIVLEKIHKILRYAKAK